LRQPLRRRRLRLRRWCRLSSRVKCGGRR
jgi:hypothetical protein